MPRASDGMNAPRKAIAKKVARQVAKVVEKKAETVRVLVKKAPVVSLETPVQWQYIAEDGSTVVCDNKEMVAEIQETLERLLERDYEKGFTIINVGKEVRELTVYEKAKEGSFPFKLHGVIYNITYKELEYQPSPGLRTPPKVLRTYEPVWKEMDAVQHMPSSITKDKLYHKGQKLYWVNEKCQIKRILVINPGGEEEFKTHDGDNFVFREMHSGQIHEAKHADVYPRIFDTDEVFCDLIYLQFIYLFDVSRRPRSLWRRTLVSKLARKSLHSIMRG